jgi:hypothetical protein
MLDEGTTVTQETDVQGDIREVTETTTTVEHKTTGDILHKDTGVVATRYEGDMDQDWGGLGPASMPDCNAYFGTGTCGKGTSSSLTTFDQYVDISEFHISDGGALEWELQMYHSQNNTTGYFETKGYSNNVLQWESGQINLENTGSPETFTGTQNFTGDLDRVFIRVGGKNNYFFDNVAYTVNYNVITTTVETWVEIVQPMQFEDIITYDIIETFDTAPTEPEVDMNMPIEGFDMAMPTEIEMPDLAPDMGMNDMFSDMPQEIETMEVMVPDIEIEAVTFEEVMQEVEVAVQDMSANEPMPETMPEPEVVEVEVEQPVEVTEVEQPAESETEPVEVAVEQPEPEEVKEEVAQEETPKEEPKEEVAEKETEEEAPVEKVEKTEEPKEEVAENKPTKEQIAKNERAKRIRIAMDSAYDPVAQMTTLALVNALGPDISTYSNQQPVVQPSWYETKDIYQNNVLPDPLGNYISVRSSLQMEEMISQQYE